MKKLHMSIFSILLCACLLFSGCSLELDKHTQKSNENVTVFSLDNIPEFSDDPYVVLNDNVPEFLTDDLVAESFERYSDLDSLGRCGTAFACVGFDIMPTTEREGIGMIKPSGWHTVKYDIVDGKYLYNRCHLIAYQLTAENANEKNLITGTRYMNVEGMLPFENAVADYVEDTLNHVLYRVTPIFKNDELVARGVQIEAFSVEDNGLGICFNVFVYNCQPGIEIDYLTGESSYANFEDDIDTNESNMYVLNTNTKKIHFSSCSSVLDISNSNRNVYNGSIQELLSEGYTKCRNCNPY